MLSQLLNKFNCILSKTTNLLLVCRAVSQHVCYISIIYRISHDHNNKIQLFITVVAYNQKDIGREQEDKTKHINKYLPTGKLKLNSKQHN